MRRDSRCQGRRRRCLFGRDKWQGRRRHSKWLAAAVFGFVAVAPDLSGPHN
jgi:hypothetical protein